MSLDRIGINSLGAVNQWIGIINANLSASSRTAYKTTRPSLTDGMGQNPIPDQFDIPSSTLTVYSTAIEWEQGSIVNSDQQTHFAINGTGFFVVADEQGRFYATRDGEFHWSSDGYLVNTAGLRVLSAGQDFIRIDDRDASQIFNQDAESQELNHYGNKTLLMVDFGNLQGLQMSKFGSTVFELDGGLPLRMQNSFDSTADGVTFLYGDDPLIRSSVDDPGFVLGQDVVLDFGVNGTATINVTATTSIQDFLTAINALSPAVQAAYDTLTDTLRITNNGAPGSNTWIHFNGVNGQAFGRFFKIQEVGSNPNGTQSIYSYEDIDNSGVKGPSADITNVATPIAGYFTPGLPVYTHSRVTGSVISDATGSRRGGFAVSQGQVATTLDLETTLQLAATTGSVQFSFGQKDPAGQRSGGFFIDYNASTGQVRLFQAGANPSDTDTLLATSATVFPTGTGQMRTAVKITEDGRLTFSIDGASTTFALPGQIKDRTGYVSIRNVNNQLTLHNISTDFHRLYNSSRTGDMFSVNQSNVAAVEVKEGIRSRPRSSVRQASLETSNASLTEYVPMLSLAQKLFSAISKIISTHNGITDDLNSLIR